MVMADTKICLSQEMGMKFFTNSKVRQPVVCTSETVRPVPYFLNAGFTASTHHVKSSGNIGNRREVLYFCLNELWKRHGQYSQISFGNVQTFWTLHLNPGLAQNEIAYDDDQWPKKKKQTQNKHLSAFQSTLLLHVQFYARKCLQLGECQTKEMLLTMIPFWTELFEEGVQQCGQDTYLKAKCPKP